MPFTPTHILAIVPIAAVRRWRLPFSALAIGSMVPDLPLFIRRSASYQASHSAPGLLTTDLPLGLAGFLIFQLLFKGVLFALLPAAVQRRCVALARPCLEPTVGFGLRAASAVVVGAATHLVWDSFTHARRTGTRLLPGLNATALTLGGHAIPGYKALQYGCTFVGLPLLAALAVLWLRRQRPEPVAGGAVLPTAAKVLAGLVAAAIPAAAVAYILTVADLSPYQKLGWVITRSGLGLMLVLTAAGIAFRALSARAEAPRRTSGAGRDDPGGTDDR